MFLEEEVSTSLSPFTTIHPQADYRSTEREITPNLTVLAAAAARGLRSRTRTRTSRQARPARPNPPYRSRALAAAPCPDAWCGGGAAVFVNVGCVGVFRDPTVPRSTTVSPHPARTEPCCAPRGSETRATRSKASAAARARRAGRQKQAARRLLQPCATCTVLEVWTMRVSRGGKPGEVSLLGQSQPIIINIVFINCIIKKHYSSNTNNTIPYFNLMLLISFLIYLLTISFFF